MRGLPPGWDRALWENVGSFIAVPFFECIMPYLKKLVQLLKNTPGWGNCKSILRVVQRFLEIKQHPGSEGSILEHSKTSLDYLNTKTQRHKDTKSECMF